MSSSARPVRNGLLNGIHMRFLCDHQKRSAEREANPEPDQLPLEVQSPLQQQVEDAPHLELGAGIVAGIHPAVPAARRRQERKEQRDERRDDERAESRGYDLADDLASRIASHVFGILVRRAPEERMLRNSEDDSAARRQEALLQDAAVVLDMLQHVEAADDVELVAERNVGGIHLQKATALQPACGAFKAGDLRLASQGGGGGKRGFHRAEHATGAAADLQKAAQARKIAPQRPDDEPVARTKPVVAVFERRQPGKTFARKGARRAQKLRRENQQISLAARAMAAPVARPIDGLHRTQARGANPHPWLPTATPATINATPSALYQESGSPKSIALRSSTRTNERLTNG